MSGGASPAVMRSPEFACDMPEPHGSWLRFASGHRRERRYARLASMSLAAAWRAPLTRILMHVIRTGGAKLVAPQ